MWYVRFHDKQLNSILYVHCIGLNLCVENEEIKYQGKSLNVLAVTVDTIRHVANSEDFRRKDLEIYRKTENGVSKFTRQAFLDMTESELRKYEMAPKTCPMRDLGDLKSRGLVTTADKVAPPPL